MDNRKELIMAAWAWANLWRCCWNIGWNLASMVYVLMVLVIWFQVIRLRQAEHVLKQMIQEPFVNETSRGKYRVSMSCLPNVHTVQCVYHRYAQTRSLLRAPHNCVHLHAWLPMWSLMYTLLCEHHGCAQLCRSFWHVIVTRSDDNIMTQFICVHLHAWLPCGA